MIESFATVTSKGQVTIPVEIRNRLGIEPGSRLVFVIDDDGRVALRVAEYPTIESLRGTAGSIGRNLSIQEMREIAREERAKVRPSE
jgi:antitoxin PrlF